MPAPDRLLCNHVLVLDHAGVVYLEVGHGPDGPLLGVVALEHGEAARLGRALMLAGAAVKRRTARAGTRAAQKPSKRVGAGFGHGPP